MHRNKVFSNLTLLFFLLVLLGCSSEEEKQGDKTLLACSNLSHGETVSRIRYLSINNDLANSCESETQFQTCDNGTLSSWSGSFTQSECKAIHPAETTPLACNEIAHGESIERIRYLTSSVNLDESCQAETQSQTCQNGALRPWTGSYQNEQCIITSDLIDVTTPQNCGEVLHEDVVERIQYQSHKVDNLNECVSETQQSTCNDGILSSWTGSYSNSECSILPTVSIDVFEYRGGFRLSSAQYGTSTLATLDFSPGIIEYNATNNSMFVIGGGSEQGVAEFKMPNIINSRTLSDFEVGSTVLQNFAPFHDTERVDTGINAHFRVTGMALINNKLIINYFNWYDANGTETDTSVVFQDPSNLDSSNIIGPFQMEGAAHAGGWLTKIPSQWQSILGGTYISGFSSGSINSRLSVGPSAFVQTPADNYLTATEGGPVETIKLLDFPLENLLFDKSIYGDNFSNITEEKLLASGENLITDYVLYNTELNNDLWTIKSRATYGFIIPGTDTYVTLGSSGGHETGLYYKESELSDIVCSGPCAVDPTDRYNTYWLWRVSDLVKVKAGEVLAYNVRPYEYGHLDLPSEANITSGTFDPETNLLYLALAQGDITGTYSRPPLYFVYKINPPVEE